ncbi:MAG: ribosome assembly cofactor RimP [Spirochaetaceae bacterium]|jgi:ribosome maturation factor RimP|nr:ribosome assembly cofactor RimP [Spirochaetaceae bacterium]
MTKKWRKNGGKQETSVRFTPREKDPLFDSTEKVLRGLGLSLIDLSVFRGKTGIQVKAVVYRDGITGVEDCTNAHRALLPSLELAFAGKNFSAEVSSPGIDRTIKDGSEFRHYLGRGVRCFRTDISDWSAGILQSADENGLTLKGKDGMIPLEYGVIAKAKLDAAQEG